MSISMTTTYNSMQSRSTLEIMLENLKKVKNVADDNESPPPLPARPVSRTRLPSQARRGFQQSHNFEKANSTFVMEAVVDSAQDLIQTNGLDNTVTEQVEIQGVLILQKCYRGYRARCYVDELKGSVITLQSLIRAEMSRKAYHHLAERHSSNTEIQRPDIQDVQSNLLQLQNAAIIIVQSGIRSWLSRRHYKFFERNNVVTAEKSLPQKTTKADSKDLIQIPYTAVLELQRQVLKTEAALQERKDQNAALVEGLKQCEERWLQHEDKMKSMEKMWLEQLTSMQVTLADAAKKRVAAKKTMTKSPELLQVESTLNIIDNSSPLLISHQNAELDDNDDENYFRVKLGCRITKKDLSIEFQKLESQFTSWEKEYSMTLEETKATMKKLSLKPPKEKNQKRWWRR
ncbi:actin binding motor protein [Lithospermum erythrorhizon]|uniref:Actin binding motor protein n=1 Tax=Lithospermum erythrorhizon TaxID=34254 RepID=A0AAV3R2R0_LITER